MTGLMTDYEADAGDRVWKLLEAANVGYRDRLKESADTAGEQLEWLKPSLMGGSRDDFYAGPAVMDASGTVLLVLAHHKKAFTMHLRPAPGHTLTEAIGDSIAHARDCMEADGIADKWSSSATIVAMKDLLKKHGRPPGQKGGELSQGHNARIIGCLFMALPDKTRADLVGMLESAIAAGVCPAIIGLLGKGSETGLCGIWPLLLPLAPYADTIIAE